MRNQRDSATTPGHDVVVVGARCAGAATAMLLAAAGHDVVLLDRSTFPSDTLSTHAIDRSGVVQLRRWGLLHAVLAAGTPPIREVVFHGTRTPERRAIKDRLGVDALVAPRRHILDTLLVDAAARAGARVVTGFTVDGVCRQPLGRVTGVHGRSQGVHQIIAARFVVGADGLRSRIAQSVGAPFTEAHAGPRGAVHFAYFAGEWDAIEYYIGDRRFAGIFPTNDGEACIWISTPAEDALAARRAHRTVADAFEGLIGDGMPALADRLRSSAARRSPVRSAIGMPNHIRRPVGPGWALVGDAGYHRDAVTGHGISDAFRDAELLADELDLALSGDVNEATALRRYHAARDRQLREIFDITRALVAFPPIDRFVELQKQLSKAIETQATTLAAQPLPSLRAVA